MSNAIDVWRRKQMAQTIVDTSDPHEQNLLIRKFYNETQPEIGRPLSEILEKTPSQKKPLFKKVGDITEEDLKACNGIY